MRRSIGRDLLNVPMGDMISQMALAIAEAQLALDESGIRQAELMSGRVVLRGDDGGFVDANGNPSPTPVFVDSMVSFGYHKDGDEYVPEQVSMMELGFTPTFYQFIDTVIEVKIEIKMTEERELTVSEQIKSTRRGVWPRRTYGTAVTTVDARYSSKYSYSAEGSSLIRTKLAPVPPPAILEERARMLLEQNQADRIAARETGTND